jgi:predicted DNA-binding transcriptional regulator AlpA
MPAGSLCGRTDHKETRVPDPGKAYWTVNDIAEYLGVKPKSVREYKTRKDLPEPMDKVGQSSVWDPKAIIEWAESRPGSGACTDLQAKAPEGS